MNVTLSYETFETKPTSAEYAKIHWIEQDLDINTIAQKLHEGHAISANFKTNGVVTAKERIKSNFKDTRYCMFDIDNSDCESISKLLASLVYKPTTAYTTLSHKQNGKGCRYRLLYFFDSPITSVDEYQTIYNAIAFVNDLDLEDNCGSRVTQLALGTNAMGEIYTNPMNIYQKSDFIRDDNLYKNTKISIKKKKTKINDNKKKNIEDVVTNEEFMRDYLAMDWKALIDKYSVIYEYFDRTPLDFNEDDLYIMLPKDYLEVKHCTFVTENGELTMHTPDGNGRKKHLFVFGIISRHIKPDITFEHLLYNTVQECLLYIDNTFQPINKQQMLEIVYNAYTADLQKQYRTKNFINKNKKFKLNMDYVKKNDIDVATARGMAMKEINWKQISKYYNSNLSLSKNVALLKKKGIKTSKATLSRYVKEYIENS